MTLNQRWFPLSKGLLYFLLFLHVIPSVSEAITPSCFEIYRPRPNERAELYRDLEKLEAQYELVLNEANKQLEQAGGRDPFVEGILHKLGEDSLLVDRLMDRALEREWVPKNRN